MSQQAQPLDAGARAAVLRRGRLLQYLTIGYNSLEGVVALVAGFLAGSVALVGFGFDSVIEVTSGSAALWRLNADLDEERRERVEAVTLRIIGACFLALAFYVTYDAAGALMNGEAPAHSVPGMVIAALSLVVMPLLSRAKRRVAAAIDSATMNADAKQTEFCTYLSAILLGGLALNAALGWWWADPIAGLVMVPIIAREGIGAWRGESCCAEPGPGADACCGGACEK